MTIEEDSKVLARSFIDSILKVKEVDYNLHFDEIAKYIEDYGFNGDWDYSIEVQDLPSIRVINEDEYDQSMDEDDQPEDAWYCDGHYILLER